MSRIGKSPIKIPDKVDVNIDQKNNIVTVKGKLGELSQKVDNDIKIKIDDNVLTLQRPSETKHHKSLHGLYRALINNMIVGVTEGYKLVLELIGVGFKAKVSGQLLEMSLGFSHDFLFELPPEVKAEVVQQKRSHPILTITSFDKQLLGQIAAKIKQYRIPEPYKGKGIKFKGEYIRRKQGKMASA